MIDNNFSQIIKYVTSDTTFNMIKEYTKTVKFPLNERDIEKNVTDIISVLRNSFSKYGEIKEFVLPKSLPLKKGFEYVELEQNEFNIPFAIGYKEINNTKGEMSLVLSANLKKY